MGLYVAGDMGPTRQKTRAVNPALVQLDGHLAFVLQVPNFVPGSHRDLIELRIDGHSHRAVKVVKTDVQFTLPLTNHHYLSRLIRRKQDGDMRGPQELR